MKRTKYTINGILFPTKKDVLDHVKVKIRPKYEDHQDLTEADFKFMVDLLRHHPWSDQKIGVGVTRIWMQKNEMYSTRCFWLQRHDGTKTDFSFHQCVQPASIERDFKVACRAAIAHAVINYRLDFFQKHAENDLVKCPVTSDLISIYESHVDHAPPATFDVIVNEFMASVGTIKPEMLTDHTDGCEGNFFADKDMQSQWVKFHNDRATLRVLSVIANLSVTKTATEQAS
jgi:hypothetical protein